MSLRIISFIVLLMMPIALLGCPSGGGGQEGQGEGEGAGASEGEGEGVPAEAEGEGALAEGEGEGALAEGEGEGAPVDETPPSVIGVSPEPLSVAPVNTVISITFSEPVDGATVNEETFTVSNSATGTIGTGGATIFFVPTAPLSYSTTYIVIAHGEITDTAGNAMGADYAFSLSTEPDNRPPRVISTTPAPWATSVSTDAGIEILFDHPMDASSISDTTVYIDGVSGNVTSDGDAVRLTLDHPLDYGTTYTVTVSADVRRDIGTPMGSDYVWVFSTEPDTYSPQVVVTEPADGAADVAIEAAITVHLDEPVDPATVTLNCLVGDGLVAGVLTTDGAVLTFEPATPLLYETIITVVLLGTVADLSGNTMGEDHVWTFTTLPDTFPPTIIAVSPPQDAEDVALHEVITVQFDGPLDPATVDDASITLSGGVTGTVSLDGTTLIFTPSEPFTYSTMYTIQVSPSIADGLGNALGHPFTWFFTTVSSDLVYSFDFVATDVAYDMWRDLLYITSQEEQRLRFVDLQLGEVSTVFDFGLGPESLTITPNTASLYVALPTHEHGGAVLAHEGYLAKIDLTTNEIVNYFEVDVDPYDLAATSDGYVYVASGSGGWSTIDVYDGTTGLKTSSADMRHQSNIALHPSKQYLYTADSDLSPSDIEKYSISEGVITSLYDSPYHGGYRMNGDLYIAPSGTYFLTRGGDLFTAATDRAADMQFIGSLTEELVQHAAFDPIHGCIFTLEPDAIRYYDAWFGNLLGMNSRKQVLDSGHIFLTQEKDAIVLVESYEGTTTIRVIKNPVTGLNDAPVASIEATPATGSTTDLFIFDASASLDEIPGQGLLFRWDWTGDGIFDTDYSGDPVAYHFFTSPGIHDVTVEALDTLGLSDLASIPVEVAGEAVSPFELGVVSEMTGSADPEIVFALDRDATKLYFINTELERVTRQIPLPNTQPIALSYSDTDNNLYIVSAFAGSVTVYDLDSQSFLEYEFSVTAAGVDIEVAPALRRIYVLAVEGRTMRLWILDMDSGALLNAADVGGASLVIDASREVAFTGTIGGSPSRLRRYSVAQDQVVLDQEIGSGGNGRKLGISPDGLHVVLPCGGGNGPGYTLYDFDALNLENVFGEWNIGTYPKRALFSRDGNYLYGTNGNPYDTYLYVMSAAGYQQIRKLPFPNCDDYARLCVTSDGSTVVGASHNTYGDDHDFALHFFKNVKE